MGDAMFLMFTLLLHHQYVYVVGKYLLEKSEICVHLDTLTRYELLPTYHLLSSKDVEGHQKSILI